MREVFQVYLKSTLTPLLIQQIIVTVGIYRTTHVHPIPNVE